MKFTDFLEPIFLIPVALILLLSGPGLLLSIRAQRISDRKLLKYWADESGVTVLKAKRRYIFMGPLTWKYAYGIGFRVDVVTHTGEHRSGWLAFFWGKGWRRMRIGPVQADVAWQAHENHGDHQSR